MSGYALFSLFNFYRLSGFPIIVTINIRFSNLFLYVDYSFCNCVSEIFQQWLSYLLALPRKASSWQSDFLCFPGFIASQKLAWMLPSNFLIWSGLWSLATWSGAKHLDQQHYWVFWHWFAGACTSGIANVKQWSWKKIREVVRLLLSSIPKGWLQ